MNYYSTGRTEEAQKNFEKAREYYKRSIALSREIGLKRVEGVHLGNLGALLKEEHNFHEAKKVLAQCIEISSTLHPYAASVAHGLLALIYAQEENPKQSQEHMQKSSELTPDLPLPKGLNACTQSEAYIYLKEEERAFQKLSQANRFQKECPKEGVAKLQKQIALLEKKFREAFES